MNTSSPSRRCILTMLILTCGSIVATTCQDAVARPTEWRSKNKSNSRIQADWWWTNDKQETCDANGVHHQNEPPAGPRLEILAHHEVSKTMPAAVSDVVTSSGQLNGNTEYVTVNSEGLKRNATNDWITDLPSALDRYNLDSLDWPSFFSPIPGLPEMHVGVDVDVFYPSGAPQYDPTHSFTITNGVCPELPGYIFGTTPIRLDPQLGLVTDSPLTASGITSFGTEGVALTVPEPSACALAVLGAAIPLVRRRREVR